MILKRDRLTVEQAIAMYIPKPAMTTKQYNAALAKLNLTPYAAAAYLGITARQCQKYAKGKAPVSKAIALLLAAYLEHGLPAKRDVR